AQPMSVATACKVIPSTDAAITVNLQTIHGLEFWSVVFFGHKRRRVQAFGLSSSSANTLAFSSELQATESRAQKYPSNQ
ncbi:MAG TPA: hypothetical protein VGO52_02710, partial [Hyphomonadaceae bacterium]|nr:hypothetical protein [Hyphomonadaceae bacterium]